MTWEFRWQRSVEFSETDLAGIVHFSNYFRYMEAAEHAFLRSLGVSVSGELEGQRYGWPRVQARCEFRAPLGFEDVFEIQVLVARLGTRSIEFAHVLRRVGTVDPAKAQAEESPIVAVGHMVSVCTTFDPTSGGLCPVPIPESLRSRLSEAPASSLPVLRGK